MTHREQHSDQWPVGRLMLAVAVASLGALPAKAQTLSDSVQRLSGSGTVFGAVTHTRQDTDTGRESNTRPSLGVSGDIGGSLQRGANNLDLRYGGTLETQRDLPNGDQTDSSSISGAARYNYFNPGGRVDFNLGHTIESVREDTGFVLNSGDYDTRNTLSGGAGLNLYPGELSRVRLSAQAGKSFSSGELDEGESLTTEATYGRRLSERSEGTLTARRSWAEQEQEAQQQDTTIDTAELGYSRQLKNGRFSLAVGASQSETEFPGQAGEQEGDAMTGHLERIWSGPEASTTVRYNRRLSDSATELSLNLSPELSFLPDSVQLRDLVVSDSLLLAHSTDRLCSVCRFSVWAEAERLQSELNDAKTHEYRASMSLSMDMNRLNQLLISWGWQGDAGEDADDLTRYTHSLDLALTRRLDERLRVGVALNQTWVRDKDNNRDQEDYGLRLFLTRDFSLMARR
ncbi:MAG: hypothetical protein HLX50_05845 [Alteromonadaceae bacterium]|nr:hypothetical protein [Alteromonadaceae bacterium]